MSHIIETERLYLRQWRASDFAIFAEINADPEIMAYFPKLLTESISNLIAKKCQQLIEDKGWGLWAVGVKNSSDKREGDTFIGFVGLNETHANMVFAPAVEIAWRLHKQYWGRGYATEAARAALQFAFTELTLDEVVSFTAIINKRSQLIMERIGMTNTQDNFHHPALNADHRLAEHVLYKITREQWQNTVSS